MPGVLGMTLRKEAEMVVRSDLGGADVFIKRGKKLCFIMKKGVLRKTKVAKEWWDRRVEVMYKSIKQETKI